MSDTKIPIIDRELTSRLGQLAIATAAMDEWLNHLLGTLVNADLGAMSIVTSEMGGGMVSKIIKNAIGVHEPKDSDLGAIRELAEYADDIRGERNVLIHGAWDPTNCEAGTCLVQSYSWGRVEIIREWLVTTADLDQLLADCDNWIEDFVKLGRQFNFPRRQGEAKSIFDD